MENQKEDQAQAVKFCPICGDTMHQESRDGGLWWVCDDPTCDFQILIKSVPAQQAPEEGGVS